MVADEVFVLSTCKLYAGTFIKQTELSLQEPENPCLPMHSEQQAAIPVCEAPFMGTNNANALLTTQYEPRRALRAALLKTHLVGLKIMLKAGMKLYTEKYWQRLQKYFKLVQETHLQISIDNLL